jgi:heat shock protein HslJ
MQITKIIIISLIFLFCTTAADADEKEITVTLTVPDTAWTVAIEEIHKVGNELWVISSVSHDPDVMAAQVISTVKASLKIAVPDLPMKNFIIGKTWAWENTEPYTFITDLKQIEKGLKSGKLLYPAAERSTDPRLVLNKTWQWMSTITPVEKIDVPNPESYTILLKDEGKIQARFDCNRGGGSYEISEGKLSLGPLISTRMACPEDSLDGPFMRDLQRVVSSPDERLIGSRQSVVEEESGYFLSQK